MEMIRSGRNIRVLILPIMLIVITPSLVLVPLGHAGNGFYYTPAQTGYVSNSNGLHVGAYGTSTQYSHNSPDCCDLHPQFYAGVELRSRDPDTDSNGAITAEYAVTNLHITVTGTDPSGAAISGQYFTPIQAWLSPQSTSTAQPLLTFIFNAMLNALPSGIGSDIQYALASGNGVSSGNPNNNAYADWTGALLNFDREHGLQLAFQMQIGTGLQGTYTISVQYHVEVTTCSNPSLFPVGCSSTSTSSQDLYDTVYYCYVVCNSPFSVGDWAGSLTLTAGGSAVTDTITATASNYFSPPNPVSVSATADDPSISLTVNPPSVNLQRTRPDSPYSNGQTTLTASLPAGACKSGTFTVTVVAQDNGLYASHAIPVTEPCDFSVSASQLSPSSIPPGGSAISTVTLTSLGFAGSVVLSASAPSGFTATLNPTTLSLSSGGTATSTLTVSISGTPNAGTYTVTVTGASGSLSHSSNVQFSYSGDFSIGPTSTLTWGAYPQGWWWTSIPTVTAVNGFAGTIMLTSSSSTGLSTTLSPSSLTLTSTTTSATGSIGFYASSGGLYSFTVTGTSGSLTHSTATGYVSVPDFSLSTNPTSFYDYPGSPYPVVISVGSVQGYSGTVQLSITLPSGWSTSGFPSSLSFSSGSSSSTTFYITPGSSTALGTYTVPITGSSSLNPYYTWSHTTNLIVTVTSPPSGGGGGGGGGPKPMSPSPITVADGSTVSVQNVKLGNYVMSPNVCTSETSTATITDNKVVTAYSQLTSQTTSQLQAASQAS